MHYDYLGDRFALIDVPGGAGFAADGLAAVQSADMALVVVDPAPERAMLAGEEMEPKTTLFDVELVVRASTAPPRGM